ncbi:MAG TPA: alpha/beta hydrolase [Candidatus Saccharimonadales bacterium]
MTFEYTWTEDDLRLMGVHYSGKDTCILMVHGMAGNIIENYFAQVLGDTLSAAGYGFVYGHNRGYSLMNDIVTKPARTKDNGWKLTRTGVAYELFEDSPKDIAAWITKVKDLGYKKIILLGHSLGCNKVIHYLHTQQGPDIVGVVLASPPDMVGLVEREGYQPNYRELTAEAQKLVADGKPRELLSGKLWDWCYISAQTYLSIFLPSSAADNLPVLHNPKVFTQLATLQQPILGIMGEHDDIAIRDLHEDIELIKSRAIACPQFDIAFIEGADHCYENREDAFASTILDWVRKTA